MICRLLLLVVLLSGCASKADRAADFAVWWDQCGERSWR
jgi:hypothetical protein